ncbi:MAG: zinc metalloprotease [Candidatus Eisenbacteria bacterium]|nr:zinc metalloprotease [Candidatus Eisenbacteria bacterium]
MALLEKFPRFRDRQFALEAHTALLRATAMRVATLRTVTVKTVVNVVYNTAAQNISTPQIRSQIAVLNRDYGAHNPDKLRVPAPWRGLVTDSKIRFRLVRVVRTHTVQTQFRDDDGVKATATGGVPPWKPDTHLNLWVCPLGGGLLGYAQFPGGPTATDGVVINVQAFGTKGTAKSPYNLGRTATHEIGHYFNLRHIWGDTPDCTGGDGVSDTPNAAGPNFGKPAFPTVTCNNGPNGDMFMNYMDYVDDSAMFMFTTQQVARMRAALSGERSSL